MSSRCTKAGDIDRVSSSHETRPRRAYGSRDASERSSPALFAVRSGRPGPVAARVAGILPDLGPVMRRLADRFDLVAPDLRGFGRSEKPTGPSDRTDADAHATDMLGL